MNVAGKLSIRIVNPGVLQRTTMSFAPVGGGFRKHPLVTPLEKEQEGGNVPALGSVKKSTVALAVLVAITVRELDPKGLMRTLRTPVFDVSEQKPFAAGDPTVKVRVRESYVIE